MTWLTNLFKDIRQELEELFGPFWQDGPQGRVVEDDPGKCS